jgi:hypothetical protein
MHVTTIARSLAALLLSMLLLAPCQAAGDPKKPDDAATKVVEATKDRDKVERTAQVLAVVGTIVTLVGGLVGSLPKVAESISLKSRRKKELEHIEALAQLMDKIKKEDVLSKATLDNIAVQIEAEIADALEGLDKNRQKRHQAVATKASREQPDLSFARRAFLWFRPHGLRGWVPHLLAFSIPVVGLCIALLGLMVSEDLASDIPVVVTILVCVVLWWLPFRAWALWERRRWRGANPLPPTGSPTVLAGAVAQAT